MCGFGNKQQSQTTPTYIPPAQTVTTGPAAVGSGAAPGVQVRGTSPRSTSSSVRMRGGSGGQVDDSTTTRKRNRSASLGL